VTDGTSAKSSTSRPDRADAPLVGLLAGTWFLAFLALFGPEARSLVFMRNNVGAAAILATLWGLTPFLIRHALLQRLHHPKVPRTKGRSKRQPLQAVHPVIKAFVLDRAQGLGIDDPLRVVRHPNSAQSVNGYVWSRGGTQYLSLTSKVEALFGAGERGDDAAAHAFRFLIDHELGHIYHRDTGIFLLARAILWCTLALLPVKLAVAYALTWDYALFDFARSLPILTDGPGPTAGLSLPPTRIGLAAYLGFTAISVGLLALFYQTLKRRREHLADRFAYLQADRPEIAADALRRLASGRVARGTAPAQSFLGGLTSHPDLKSRVARMRRPAGDRRRDGELFAMAIAAMIVGRVALANHEGLTWLPIHSVEKTIFTIIYIALASLLIACTIAAPREPGEGGTSLVWRNLAELTLWAGLVAAALAFTLVGLWWLAGRPPDPASALLRQVEVVEAVILVASLPVVVAVLGACHAGLAQRGFTRHLRQPALTGVLATALGLTLLWATSLASRPLDLWRDAQNERIRSHLYDALEAANVCKDDGLRPSLEREACDAQSEWFAELIGLVDTQFHNQSFQPPLTWLLLWQQSFRRPSRTA